MKESIGNYIHLHYKNYLKYGYLANLSSEEKFTNTEASAKNFFNEQKNDIFKKISVMSDPFTQQELEDYANAVRISLTLSKNAFKISTKSNQSAEYLISKYAEDLLRNGFNNYTNYVNITKEGDIGSIYSSLLEGEDKLLEKIQIDNTTQKISVDRLMARFEQALNIITKGLANNSSDINLLNIKTRLEESKAAILNAIEEGTVETTSISLTSSVQDKYNSILGESVHKVNDKWQAIVLGNSVSTNKNTFNLIQEAVSAYDDFLSIFQVGEILKNMKGMHLENIGALAALIGVEPSLKDINKSIKELEKDFNKNANRRKYLVGSSTSSAELNYKAISNRVYKAGKDAKLAFSCTKGNNSQQKVDIAVTWNNKDMLISAKNLNINFNNSELTLVSGTPLLYWLSFEKTAYVNHYLNVTAEHKESNDSKPSDNLIHLAHESAMLTVFLGAIQGKHSDKKIPNVLLINDNKSLNVKALSMKQVALNLYNNFDNFISISGLTYNSSFTNSRAGSKKENILDPDGRMRIANLLNDVHSKKIKMAINHNKLLSMMN